MSTQDLEEQIEKRRNKTLQEENNRVHEILTEIMELADRHGRISFDESGYLASDIWNIIRPKNNKKKKEPETVPVSTDTGWDESLRGPKMSDTTGRTIYKYQMPILEEFTLDLPEGAEIIRTATENGMLWLWAIVNTNATNETRKFRAFKTGGQMPDGIDLTYIGFCPIYVQMELGLYIFEVDQK